MATEVFNQRYSKELYDEYGKWLPYITDVTLPCLSSENGDFLHFPFPGSLMDQPYVTFQICKVIQGAFKNFIAKKKDEQLKLLNMRHRK